MSVTLGAVGKVCTGFSKPKVAKYSASAGVITYSDVMDLARGVDVDMSPESSSDNSFYANNQLAESAPKRFINGTVTLTVDGLLAVAERFIMGLPDAETDGWTAYNDEADPPYVGLGFIARYMSGGVESFVPFVLPKVKFNLIGNTAATQNEEIDWQTQSIDASIFRADDTNHTWKWIGDDFATETEAETALETKLGKTASTTTTTSSDY